MIPAQKSREFCITVPSKHRSDGTVFKVLQKYKDVHDILVYVEADDYTEYAEKYSGMYEVVVLPESNKGIGSTKSHILSDVTRRGYSHVYILDDDIRVIKKRVDVKKYTADFDTNPFVDGFQYCKSNDLAIMAFAHVYSTRFVEEMSIVNSIVSQFVLLDVAEVSSVGSYDASWTLYEDMDLHFRVVLSGMKAEKWFGYAYDVPPDYTVRQTTGGCSEFYQRDKDRLMDTMEIYYHGIVSSRVNKDGNRKFRISWKKLYELAERIS